MNKDKKTLPLGVSPLAKEIKHLQLRRKKQYYKCYERKLKEARKHSDNDPLSCS